MRTTTTIAMVKANLVPINAKWLEENENDYNHSYGEKKTLLLYTQSG